jgi:hypothetical protein
MPSCIDECPLLVSTPVLLLWSLWLRLANSLLQNDCFQPLADSSGVQQLLSSAVHSHGGKGALDRRWGLDSCLSLSLAFLYVHSLIFTETLKCNSVDLDPPL